MAKGIPNSVNAEHEELHAELTEAINVGGKTGVAAQAVADLLHEHFVSEEEYALPPLGYLVEVSRGEVPDDWERVVDMADRLRTGLPQMLDEHRQIVAALQKLMDAAREESQPKVERFCEKLMLHAKSEEEIFYPAAILVGEHLKMLRAEKRELASSRS